MQEEEKNQRQPLNITSTNYVGTAETVMKTLNSGKTVLTTSKIRNILSMVSDLYNDVKLQHNKVLSEEFQSRVQYLRLHLAYEAGRENAVKNFVEQADLMNQLNNIGDSRDRLILFCHYMEALVAYHRFYDGKD
jgi:CRISPR-associated protein Csm2